MAPANSLEGWQEDSPYCTMKASILSLSKLIGIMTRRECYGQMRPNILAIHAINMFGSKMETIDSKKYQKILAENLVTFA